MHAHAYILIWDAHTHMEHGIVPYVYEISHTRMGHLICVWADICIWGRTVIVNMLYFQVTATGIAL